MYAHVGHCARNSVPDACAPSIPYTLCMHTPSVQSTSRTPSVVAMRAQHTVRCVCDARAQRRERFAHA